MTKFGEWQPIETAPKDRHILIGSTEWAAVWLGYWRHDREVGMRKEPAGWSRVNFFDYGLDPTHWCDLPEPPQ